MLYLAILHFADSLSANAKRYCQYRIDYIWSVEESFVWNVEVKGTVGTGEKVIITRGEAKHAQANPDRAVLFVLSDIRVQPGPDGAPKLSGGTERILQPWDLDVATLIPISYEHSPRYPAT